MLSYLQLVTHATNMLCRIMLKLTRLELNNWLKKENKDLTHLKIRALYMSLPI